MDNDQEFQGNRSWPKKFRNALRGVFLGIKGQSSFLVHLPAAVLVVILAALLQVGPTQWCLLLLCIALVMAAEIFNSAIESMAQAIDRQHNKSLGEALDMASGAVLIASLGAAIVGAIVLLRPLAFLFLLLK